jgi:cytochrome P450
MSAGELNPLSAVTAASPYPYYVHLAREMPNYYDDALGMRVLSSASEVEAAFRDPELRVRPLSEPVPVAIVGTPIGDLFATLTRMTDGEHHNRTKKEIVDASRGWNERTTVDAAKESARMWASTLKRDEASFLQSYMYGVAPLAMASMLGLERTPQVVTLTGDFARALSAGASKEEIARGSAAALALPREMPLLFQSYDACAALIGNTLLHVVRGAHGLALTNLVEHVVRYDPPVQNTRRYSSDGATLLVLAAANRDPDNADRIFTFGLGSHACPAMILAVSVAVSAVEHLFALGLDPTQIEHDGYAKSPNCRIPQLRVRWER